MWFTFGLISKLICVNFGVIAMILKYRAINLRKDVRCVLSSLSNIYNTFLILGMILSKCVGT